MAGQTTPSDSRPTDNETPETGVSVVRDATPLALHLDTICSRLAQGTGLRAVCRELGLGESNVRFWLSKDEEAHRQVKAARELGCDSLADEAIEIADDVSRDWKKRTNSDGSTEDVVDTEHIQRSKLRIDTRLRLIGQWSRRYGDKVQHEHTGKDGGAIVTETRVPLIIALSARLRNKPEAIEALE